MHAYVLSPNENARSITYGTLQQLRAGMRERISKESRDWARITLEDFPSDKEAFIALLNGQDVPAKAVLRKWRLSPRGKLIEIQVTED